MADQRDPLLDHEVDGIRELDNALPRWWLYMFYVTIAFAVVYMVNYHMLPQPFLGGPSLAAEYAADVAASGRPTPTPAAGTAAAVVVARVDKESLTRGEAIFNGQANACFSCHRVDLGGLIGPNLTDDLWMHGCSADAIVKNIVTGFPTKGMMPYGTTAKLSDDQLLDVASYILSKHDTHPANPKPAEPERDVRCEGSGEREKPEGREKDGRD